MQLSEAVLKSIEADLGKSIEEIRNQSLSEHRKEVEAKHGKPMSLSVNYPTIGRGNVLRDCVLSHEQVEAQLEKALSSLNDRLEDA
jgi:hypothetical protein